MCTLIWHQFFSTAALIQQLKQLKIPVEIAVHLWTKNKESVMDDSQVQRILNNPKFQEMVSKKRKLSWTLTAIMLVIYVGFMLLVGYNKEFLSSSVSGGVTTWGIPLGLGIIMLSFILCGVYSYIANNRLDQLNQETLKEIEAIAYEEGTH